MNFKVNHLNEIDYNIVQLSAVFPELKEYETKGADYKQFEVLYQQDQVLLCALKTQSRIEFLHMDLEKETFEAFANLTGYEDETISLDVREMRMVYVALAGEEEVRHGVFDSAWGAFKHSFYRPNNEDVLFLNHDYCLISKSDNAWQFENDQWQYHKDQDELYLYEVATKSMHRIYDERLINTWHTKENHHLVTRGEKTYLVNVPFNMDPYEYEEIMKADKTPQQVCDANISFINFEQFIQEVKAGKKELSLETLLSFEDDNALYTNMIELETETRLYGLFDFTEKSITIYKLNDALMVLDELTELSFEDYDSSYNIVLNKEDVVVHQENKVDLLNTGQSIKTDNHETFFYQDGKHFFFTDWTEDEQGENYREFLIVKNSQGETVYRKEGFFIMVEGLKLLLEI
ncbi:MAG TPA: hypothetical protein VIG45_04705 [Erysipelothrix sp.]